MGSTRLPGKIMLDLAGKPVLMRVIERCFASVESHIVVVATSTDPLDDAVHDLCVRQGIEVFRGNLLNVLDRYYHCALRYKLDVIVRVTADCPFIDPFIIDESIRLFRLREVAYVSNCLERNFPRGLDCEVFSFAALKDAYQNAAREEEKEHVTLYIIKKGKTLVYPTPPAYQGEMHLTLDEQADYDLLKLLYEKFDKREGLIDVQDVIVYLHKHPELVQINAGVAQKTT